MSKKSCEAAGSAVSAFCEWRGLNDGTGFDPTFRDPAVAWMRKKYYTKREYRPHQEVLQ